MATEPAVEARPSERARTLVAGAYDLHVHVAPDVPKRRIDDVTLRTEVRRGRAGGLRPQVPLHVDRGARADRVRGRAGRAGDRDADAQQRGRRDERRRRRDRGPRGRADRLDADRRLAGARPRAAPSRSPATTCRSGRRLQHELRELGLSVEPVEVTDADGSLLPETRDVLRAIARHDLILATGHLGRDDTFAVVDGAFEEGVKDVVVTHPEFPCQNFSIEDQVALAERGCLIERCLTTPHSGKTTWEHVFDGVRAVGVERTIFSSDCGNPDYPAVEDGLAIWADRLLEAAFDEDEVREMIVAHSRRLAGDA